jgi:two-component system sensor histidine kinase UhpB
MRKKILTTLLVIICFEICTAQNQNKIDSLMTLLKTAKEDTNKANVFIGLSISYHSIEPAKSFEYDKKALALSEKLDYKKGIINATNNIGVFYMITGKYVPAKEYFLKEIPLIEKYGEKKLLIKPYKNLAQIEYQETNYTASAIHLEKALKIAEEVKDSTAIGKILANKSTYFVRNNDYSAALSYLFKALSIFQSIGDTTNLTLVYSNVGNIYLEEENSIDKALEYFQLSLKAAKRVDDKQQIAMALYQIGDVYFRKQMLADALNYCHQSAELFKEIGFIYELSMCYEELGNIYSNLNKYDKAIKYSSLAVELARESGDKYGISSSVFSMGNIQLKKKEYKKAISNFKQSLAIANEIDSKLLKSQNYEQIAETYNQLHDYKSAYTNHVTFSALNDSIRNEKIVKNTSEMEAKYQSEKKEKELAVLTKDKEIQNIEIRKQKLLKNSFIGGLTLVLILSFFVYNNFRTVNKLKLQNIRNKIANDLHDDVGSTLNSISVYSEVAKQKSPTVIHELEQIGDASRKIIEVMSDIVWTINPKNDAFEEIILRMSTLTYNLLKAKNIEHTFRADECMNEIKLTIESRRNFYLIFKEALNNLVKYSNATRASILLTGEDGLIKFSVRDNGVGFDVSLTSKGNGLLNMKTRADEMKAQLKIESEKGIGTNVELILKG